MGTIGSRVSPPEYIQCHLVMRIIQLIIISLFCFGFTGLCVYFCIANSENIAPSVMIMVCLGITWIALVIFTVLLIVKDISVLRRERNKRGWIHLGPWEYTCFYSLRNKWGCSYDCCTEPEPEA